MTEIFEDIIKNIDGLVKKVSKKSEKYVKKAISKGNKISQKGINQLEIEKLKWELKKKYQEVGKYVTQKKEAQSVTDFSHDPLYLQKINTIIKLKYYIEERLKSKGTF